MSHDRYGGKGVYDAVGYQIWYKTRTKEINDKNTCFGKGIFGTFYGKVSLLAWARSKWKPLDRVGSNIYRTQNLPCMYSSLSIK